MQMKLELIPLPVSDVDRAIVFYEDKLGFKKDFDVKPSEGVRIVQLTPEGSGCSVGFGTGLDVYAGKPGSVRGLHLAVEDIVEARADLVRRGVEIGEIQDFGGGVKGADFSDPDGNTFELQEMAWRQGRRLLGAWAVERGLQRVDSGGAFSHRYPAPQRHAEAIDAIGMHFRVMAYSCGLVADGFQRVLRPTFGPDLAVPTLVPPVIDHAARRVVLNNLARRPPVLGVIDEGRADGRLAG